MKNPRGDAFPASRRPGPRKDRRSPRARLRVEALEPRCLLAARPVAVGVTSAFREPSPSSAVFSGQDTPDFSWGKAADGGAQSRFSFRAEASSAAPGAIVRLGTLTYFNGTTQSDTSIDSVTLDLAATIGGQARHVSTEIDVSTTDNIDDDPDASSDSIYLYSTSPSSASFTTADGAAATLDVLGFGTVDGSGFHPTRSVTVPEGKSAPIDFFGRVAETDIALTGIGLNPDGTVSARYSITGDPGTFPVALYASADATLDDSDFPIGGDVFSPSANTSGEFSLDLPSEVSAAYLLAMADPPDPANPRGHVLEADEANNFQALPLPVVSISGGPAVVTLNQAVSYTVTTSYTPADPLFDLQVKRAQDADWTTIASSSDGQFPITPKLAGTFQVRGVLEVGGTSFATASPASLPLTVQFPGGQDVLNDPSIVSAMNSAAQSAIQASGKDHSRAFENGFAVQFDSRSGQYQAGPLASNSRPLKSGGGGSDVSITIPGDSPEAADIRAFLGGAVYTVARFHSHPARRSYKNPTQVGASEADIDESKAKGLPEIVYDFDPTGEIFAVGFSPTKHLDFYADYGTVKDAFYRKSGVHGIPAVRAKLPLNAPAHARLYGPVTRRATPP